MLSLEFLRLYDYDERLRNFLYDTPAPPKNWLRKW